MKTSETNSKLFWLTVFGIAFGFFEASVVIYLRALYYPEGFVFPLVLPQDRIILVELGRELATLLMLLGVAMTSAGNGWERFGVFSFLFGVWDLVYYLVLRVFLGWPESLLTWDVLFLVPRVWVGPVLSAAAVAVSLVVGGAWIIRRAGAGFRPRTPWWVWAGAVFSLALLLGSFMDGHDAVRAGIQPGPFPWLPWLGGMILGWGVFAWAFLPRPGIR